MYDTIGLRITLGNGQIRTLADYQNKVQEIGGDGRIIWEYTKGLFTHPSYSRQIYFFIDKNAIRLSFSLPKFLYGHNCVNYSDLNRGLSLFRHYLTECMPDIEWPPVESWEITRVDFSTNYILPDNVKITDYLEYLANFDFNRKQKNYYNGTVLYRGSSYSVKFYDKQKELLKHDIKYIEPEQVEKLLGDTKNMIRFEITGRHEFLKYYFKKDKITCEDLTKEHSMIIMNSVLDRLFKTIPTEYQDRVNALTILVRHYKVTEAYRLWGMLELLTFPGKKSLLRSGLDKRKIYRDLAKLRKAGFFEHETTDTNASEFSTINLRLPSTLQQPDCAP